MDPSILLLVVTVGLLVVLVTSQRRRQREQQTVQSRLAPGCEVMTSSGLYATVVGVDDAVVVLETAPGQQSRWDRRAVVRVVTAVADSGPATADPHAVAAEPAAGDDVIHGGDVIHEEPRSPAAEVEEPAGREENDGPVAGQAPGDPPPERR